mmetsp:Transcript_26202/g.23190  ORF Transcript_26202/g.23190 Transcript_26202/m.23190 type:complete len:165 (+) Transcript_26202:83-577(+)
MNNMNLVEQVNHTSIVQELKNKAQSINDLEEFYQILNEMNVENAKIKDFFELYSFGDDKLTMAMIVGCRKLLSLHNNSPIQDFIDTGLVNIFIELLDKTSNDRLKHEILWALTNVASGTGDHVIALTQAGLVKAVLPYLSNDNLKIKEQTFWAIGNIAGEGPLH